eukprot:8148903-Prorocentrum_lima.AAC.1
MLGNAIFAGSWLRRHTHMRNTLALACRDVGACVHLERSYLGMGIQLVGQGEEDEGKGDGAMTADAGSC